MSGRVAGPAGRVAARMARMDTMACGHVALAHRSMLWAHLLGEGDHDAYVRQLLGDGLSSDYVCKACGELDEVELIAVCEGCVARVTESELGSVRGWATVKQRAARISMQRLGSLGAVLAFPGAVAPCRDGWLTVGQNFVVRHHGARGGREVATLPPLPEETDPAATRKAALALHASRDGSAVALVRDYGRYGVVASTGSGEVLMHLDRGEHRVDLTRFPCAFAERDSAPVLVAGTDWNRVDAWALPSCRMLTERGPTRFVRGADRPGHYLDYFHGALRVSPDGTRVVDDGWVWLPVGVPLLWDLSRWFAGDTWQAEDAAALQQRNYLWDAPMCWINDDHLALWGVGDDDATVLPGVTLLSLSDGSATCFPGVPRQNFWSDGSHLFVRSEIGMTVWDPFAGERVAELVGFHPLSYNPYLDEFLLGDDHGATDRVRLVVD